jgi:REP-associated tyrosine transposase
MTSGDNAEGRASARPALKEKPNETLGTPSGTATTGAWTRGSASLRVRQHPIHLPPDEVPNRSIIIFVTVCTKNRRKILATSGAHEALLESWKSATAWLVGRYVILPDHVHLFCAPGGLEAPPLERWIQYWKSLFTKQFRLRSDTVWQRHHWDRQLRRGESYDEKWEYGQSNPVRHRCVTTADEWPYKGELNELRW